MIRRFLAGALIGALIGGAVAAGLVFGLKIGTFATEGAGALLAYAAAVVSGVLVGLFAGKPIWATGAKVEAGLKAAFGALFAAAAMFALRRWAGQLGDETLAAFSLGRGGVGMLPETSLPALAALLGGFYGADNTAEPAPSAAPRARVATPAAPRRASEAVRTTGSERDDGDEAQSSGAARRSR